jgi:integrase
MLWESASVPWVDSVLILLYTGFRISEFLGIKREEVNIEDWYITGGVKTSAGKNRIVPIHSRIRPLILERYNQGHKYLITSDGSHMSRSTYLLRWTEIMKNHGMDHVPHECRHTLETRLDSANANRRCIDLIIGHKSKDVGNRVYNHKTIEQLKEAIEKID